MNGALKSFSLNNLFSCELSCLSHKWILTLCERRIVHNLFLYISNAKKEEKKRLEKKNDDEKKEKKKKYGKVKEEPCRKELTLTGCNVHMCIYVQLTVIFWGEQTSRGSINYIFIHRIVN